MLGETIVDTEGVDGFAGEVAVLCMLPARTVMAHAKTTQVKAAQTPAGQSFSAYEIHLGVTTLRTHLPSFAVLEDGTGEGVRHGRILGTYLHGAFEAVAVFQEIFGFASVDPPQNYFDLLASWLETSANRCVLADLLDG